MSCWSLLCSDSDLREMIAAFNVLKGWLRCGEAKISAESSGTSGGMNLDMNSVTSQDLSSTWAAALPGFLHRRGAVAGPSAVPPVRRYSSTSDTSMESTETGTFKCGLCETDDHDITSKDCPVKQKALKAHRQRQCCQRSVTQEERDADIPTSNRFNCCPPTPALVEPDSARYEAPTYSDAIKRGKKRIHANVRSFKSNAPPLCPAVELLGTCK
ncbi:hypothetical protein HPB51_020336 [Rhipicephalus microplus]|uniref:Uncharacterized protein n=1 Tax=Rhipicephalus microplus TaxID=6941 RepID=A0A9J6DX76_RHIMP|nr:hypothetical protein HPB51_020336 [Rhipicephalus microplus]